MKSNSTKGSVLLSAVILGSIMALASATYIAVAYNSYKRANRAYYYNSALNLAESGAEEAMWALNNSADTHDWSKRSWTGTTNRLLTGSINTPDFVDSNGTKGYYSVYVENAETYNPTIYVQSVLQLASGSAVRKQLKIESTRLISKVPSVSAKDWAKIAGILDSYDPALGTYITAPTGYDMTVASPTVDIGDLSLGANGNIYGNISIGVASENSDAFVSSIKGNLLGPDTVQGADGVVKVGSNLVDTNRISYDYSQDFPMEDAPGGSFLTSLPSADPNGMIVIGDPSGTPTTVQYQLSSLTVNTGETLLVVGPVNIVVSGTVDVKGQGAVNILNSSYSITTTTGHGPSAVTTTTNYPGSSSAKLQLYGYGDISISGNGTAIPISAGGSDPSKFRIIGMNTSSQNITIGGNGNLAADVYAPNANMVFNGGGSTGYFAGTMVGNTIKINGAGYKVRTPKGSGATTIAKYFTLKSWREMTDPTTWHSF